LGGYLLFGQPGFFGEDLFVVLTDQLYPNVNENIEDPIQIRSDVYNSLTSFANQSQSDIRDSLDQFGIKYQPYYLVNGLQVQGGPLLRIWLNTRPEVDRILDNPQLRPLQEKPPIASGTDSAPSEPQWNQKLIQADRVWDEYGVTGEGIIIGQSDSGVQGDHPELMTSYRGRIEGNTYNWLDPWYQSPTPVDIGGHGTHTLGSILGTSTGIAPGAEWIACVNLARNLGNPAYYLDCMQFMLAPYPQGGDPFSDGIPEKGANVLNNSWGCPPIEGCDEKLFQPAMQALREAGIFIVASAGNEGPACGSLDNPIAIYDEVFSTGAIDRFGELAFFSSRGPVDNAITSSVKPDIVAPGVDVLSSYPNNTYSTASGTSMAGPHIVGVVALIWSANPELIGDIDSTEQILAETATQYSGTLPQCIGAGGTPSTAVGYGIVNAFEAVKRALELSPTR
jgi:subtilisin family serine protease